jgi:hypothetical protein
MSRQDFRSHQNASLRNARAAFQSAALAMSLT